METKREKLYFVFLFAYLLFCLVTVIVNQEFFLTYRLIRIDSNSMAPSLLKNSLILIKKQSSYSVGDIVSYYNSLPNDQKLLITHRIIKTLGHEYVTKGDNNLAVDPPVEEKLIIGKVILAVPLLGLLSQKDRYPLILATIYLPAFYFIINEVKRIRRRSSLP